MVAAQAGGSVAVIAIAVVALATPACRRERSVDRLKRGGEQEGIASWYGPGFHGKRTASGARFDMHGRTAAHRTLPFGTRVRVTRLDDGRSVTVTVNDRGPFVRGRIIDLSLGAARAIGVDRDGVARVALAIDSWPEGAGPGTFAVQVGAFKDPINARRLRDQLARRWQNVVIMEWFEFNRVRVGAFASEDEAEVAARELQNQLDDDGLIPFVTRTD